MKLWIFVVFLSAASAEEFGPEIPACGRCDWNAFYTRSVDLKQGYDIFDSKLILKHTYQNITACRKIEFNCPALNDSLVYLQIATSDSDEPQVLSAQDFFTIYQKRSEIVCDFKSRWVLNGAFGTRPIETLICAAPQEKIVEKLSPTAIGKKRIPTPPCGRCKWNKKIAVKSYHDQYPGFKVVPYDEALKEVKKADGCLEAQFNCPAGSLVHVSRSDSYSKPIPVEEFNEKYNKISCEADSQWTISGKESDTVSRLFCLKKE